MAIRVIVNRFKADVSHICPNCNSEVAFSYDDCRDILIDFDEPEIRGIECPVCINTVIEYSVDALFKKNNSPS